MIYRSSSSKGSNSLTNRLTPEVDTRSQSSDNSVVSVLPPTILVVDDDAAVAGMLRDALTSWGYDVVLASNGREGLHALGKQHLDGILLDINMPVMGGETMLDELRWLGYQTPVVVISGGDVPTLRRLVKEGAQAFAIKPFLLPSLKKLCERVFICPADGAHLGIGKWSSSNLALN
jgi:CheY-like chemotaxis protein